MPHDFEGAIARYNQAQKRAKEILERSEDERLQAEGTQRVILDDSNIVTFPGSPYGFEALNEKILVAIDIFKSGFECKVCKGKKKIETKIGRETQVVECSECRGIGATLVLPDTAVIQPTTGVVVSMGTVAKEKAHFKHGDRILFGPYAGQMIYTKAGAVFKYMDWNLGAVKISGAEGMDAFDFIIVEDKN
jgi:co-chaperonin GroES (HSP10)